MSRLNANRRRALANLTGLMECDPDCEVALVVMHPGAQGINLDLVAYCEADILIVAATYLLSVARDRMDRTQPGLAAAFAGIEAAMAVLPCGAVPAEAGH